jgi:lysophospholipase L1-like esterase
LATSSDPSLARRARPRRLRPSAKPLVACVAVLTLLAWAGHLPGQQPGPATYVAVGDSLAAGVVSASLVETRQRHSFPAIVARQAGVADFQQPLVSEPGIPPELSLQALLPNPLIAPKAVSPGLPLNLGLGRSYDNLGVPGATVVDALTRTTDTGGAHDLVLRGRGTAVAQAAGLQPGVLLLWIGNNDVLPAVVQGRAVDGVTLTPSATFRQAYEQVVSALRPSGARIVAANIPDVTTLPFVTTIPPVVVDPLTRAPVLVDGRPVPLLGPTGPLPPGSFVTLAAASLLARGEGIPQVLGGRGVPLPGEVILDPAEIAAIRARVEDNNRAIADVCRAAGVTLLDVHALSRELAGAGRHVAGIRLDAGFLTGGVYSYDGIHPTALGYALLANEWIRALGEAGVRIPPVQLSRYLGLTHATTATGSGTPLAWEFGPEAWAALRAFFPSRAGE